MINIKELAKKKEMFQGGHHMCAGCGAAVAIRQALIALSDKPVVSVSATGCVEVATSLIPSTSWLIPWFHSAFENSAASASGIWAAYKALKKKMCLPDGLQIIVFGGDGGTYDIGLQSLSGAAERGDNFIYVCYNNEAYMNTGMQKSSATPEFALSSTTPEMKKNNPKDLTKIMIAHNIEYAAQASIGYQVDYMNKVQKATTFDGVKFINVITPCTRGWGFEPSETINYAKKATDTGFWPSYEVSHGKYHITQNKSLKPISEFLEGQKRYNLDKNSLEIIQKNVYNRWGDLLRLENEKQTK